REARAAGAHYLLYCRFARGDNRIGNWEEWEESRIVAMSFCEPRSWTS
ncbi:DUF4823 domain-containing protein, partial [Pseudomonas aeruginosa]